MKKIHIISGLALLLFTKFANAGIGEENPIKIRITSKNIIIEAILNDSSASQDLLKKLPLTLNLHKHQNREYYANIKLDKNNTTQQNYVVGSIGYWTTGNTLVLFYDKGYTDSLIFMGKITKGLNLLSGMDNTIQARIERIED